MKHPYRWQYQSCGPKLIEKLDFLGIDTIQKLQLIWAEGAMELYIKKYWGRKKWMCSCIAYQFEGLVRNCPRNEIPEHRKKELIVFTRNLKKITQTSS